MDPRAIVHHAHFTPGRRVIAVSDIHGNLPFFLGLMEDISLTPDDILVLVGDLLEKGADSLGLLHRVMALAEEHTVYAVCGNCDELVYRFAYSDGTDEGWERFYRSYLPQHPESAVWQFAR